MSIGHRHRLGGLIVPVFAQNGAAGSEDQGTSMAIWAWA
jgi:hypothetical protein